MILPPLPARFEDLDGRMITGYSPAMTLDPDQIAARRRKLAANKERMAARWLQAEIDVAIQELALLNPTLH